MRKEWYVFVALMSAILPATPARAAVELLNANYGFEQAGAYGSTDPGPGWTQCGPGLLTVTKPDWTWEGKKSISMFSTADGVESIGSIIQTVNVPTGEYNLVFTGWTRGYNSNPSNFSWVRADLFVDTNWVNAFEYERSDGSWYYGSDQWTGHVDSSLSLLVTQGVNGNAAPGVGVAESDNWHVWNNNDSGGEAPGLPAAVLLAVGAVVSCFIHRRKS